MSVAPVRYAALTEGSVALAAAGTAKSILGVTAAANRTFKITNIKLATTGKTAGDDPLLIEILKGDGTSAGTSTSVTPRHVSGNPSITVQATAGKNYTAEPTTLTLVDEFMVDPNKSLAWFDLPLGRELESGVGKLIVIRATVVTGTTVSGALRARLEFEE